MHQSSEKQQMHQVTTGQGLGYYPISNIEYDVINVIAEKSRALQAYDAYLRDSKPVPELVELFEQIKADDRRHIEQLRKFIGNA